MHYLKVNNTVIQSAICKTNRRAYKLLDLSFDLFDDSLRQKKFVFLAVYGHEWCGGWTKYTVEKSSGQ